MRSSVYVYVLLALTSSLALAAPLSTLERRNVFPPDIGGPISSSTPPPPTVTKNPFGGSIDPLIVLPGEAIGERAEGRGEFPHVAGQSNEDVPVPPDFGAFRVKREDGAPLPVPGQAGHSFFPISHDLDSPVDLPTPILDRDDGGIPDFLVEFYKTHPPHPIRRDIGSTPILDREDEGGVPDSLVEFYKTHPPHPIRRDIGSTPILDREDEGGVPDSLVEFYKTRPPHPIRRDIGSTPILDREDEGGVPDSLVEFYKTHPPHPIRRDIGSTPILDRDAQTDFSEFLNNVFEANPNRGFDRDVD
ncbi:hypothetical protein BC826DRAFT_38608 [Russula brevipes]|nr:hypothetical protein BC826DRAFT_38608 [Russula brevipes]